MTQPTVGSVHIDAPLSQVSIMHRNQAFIAARVFPVVRVQKKSDKYFTFPKGAWFRRSAGKRAPGAPAMRSGYVVSTDNYNCEESALAHDVPIETIRNADVPLKPLRTGAKFVANAVKLDLEIDVSTIITTAANWTTSDDVAGAWLHTLTGSNNTFIPDIFAKKKTVRQLIGANPNTMLMDEGTFDNCCQIDSVLDRIKYGGDRIDPAKVTPSMLAELFGFDEVLVGGSIYSDAEEVAAGTDFNAVQLWETNAGKGSCWIGYVAPEPEIEVPSAGYTYLEDFSSDLPEDLAEMVEEAGSSQVPVFVRRWWENDAKKWVVEGFSSYDVKKTAADAGCLFYDTLST